jgi:uncharacterized protein (TIGR02594 family)
MPGERYRVTAQSLNVREGPTVSAAPIGHLHEGDVITHVQTSGDGYWLKVRKDALEGWSSHKYLELVVPDAGDHHGDDVYPWMSIAAAEKGVKESPGNGDNPRIIEYLKSTTLGAPHNANDETKWCSAFVNWCVERAGYEGTDSAWALSWLNWGKKITTPRHGCIVVLKSGPESRHVAFYTGETATHVELLGGNQSDAVNIAKYRKTTVVGYRIPG